MFRNRNNNEEEVILDVRTAGRELRLMYPEWYEFLRVSDIVTDMTPGELALVATWIINQSPEGWEDKVAVVRSMASRIRNNR
jgi:hypothetical protein